MKKWQFRTLIAVIISCYIIQTIFLFYKFHWAQQYNYKAYDLLLHKSYDIEDIKESTDQTLEIATKYMNRY